MDDRIPAKAAWSFTRTTGMEQEDLLQEARLAVIRAEPHYNPHKAAWSTFSTTCVTRQLCGVVSAERRKHPQHEELGDWLPSQEPGPEDRAIFMELLRQLPEDARTIVDMIFSDASIMAGMTPARARRTIKAVLMWPADRVDVACAAIVTVLRGGPMIRRT